MASVAVGIWVGVGGRFETAEISGVAHFIEHLLFKGTRRRSAKEISEAVEGIGGYLNAFTTEENTCFHARAHAEHTDDLLDVLVDMLVNSRFAPADISKERDVIKEEIAMYRDQPQQLVHDLLHETLWPNHPLGRPLTGTEKTLDAIRRAEMLSFMRANYSAPNTVLAVAGPLRHGDVLTITSATSTVDGVLAIHRGDPDHTEPSRVRNGRAEIVAAMELLRSYVVTPTCSAAAKSS